MIQEIAPHSFSGDYQSLAPRAEDLVLLFEGASVLCKGAADALSLPKWRELSLPSEAELHYAFLLDGVPVFLCLSCPESYPDGFAFVTASTLRTAFPRHMAWAVAVGGSLARWYRGTRFCGQCGSMMEDSPHERARCCPSCGNIIYPKISPAVIVAVTDGERLLLTRYANRPFKAYALVAGFNEIGESIEDTVRREVMEETGLMVKNLRFYRSQPWVFTDSLLMGFFVDLQGDDRIRLQESELAEAGWFYRNELPTDHSEISLTGEMIERFRMGQEP